MSEELIKQLIAAGILGPIVVGLAYAYVRKDRECQRINDARVEDQKANAVRYQELNDWWRKYVQEERDE